MDVEHSDLTKIESLDVDDSNMWCWCCGSEFQPSVDGDKLTDGRD